jgi:hypothetical protein
MGRHGFSADVHRFGQKGQQQLAHCPCGTLHKAVRQGVHRLSGTDREFMGSRWMAYLEQHSIP